jgi:hypothetical protein
MRPLTIIDKKPEVWRAPVAVRFIDHLTKWPVTEGLRVTAQRLSKDRSQRIGRAVVGCPTPSNVIAFPGLMHSVGGDTDPELMHSGSNGAEPFAIDVEDCLGNYLPMRFVIDISGQDPPSFQKGPDSSPLLKKDQELNCESQELNCESIYLWSASTRRLPSHWAIVRAEIFVEYELSLLLPNDGDALPEVGKNLIVIAKNVNPYRILVFNSEGKKVIDRGKDDFPEDLELHQHIEDLDAQPIGGQIKSELIHKIVSNLGDHQPDSLNLYDSPADFAIVEVTQEDDQDGSFHYFGMTDAEGILFLPIPYPKIQDPETTNGSEDYPPLDDQKFKLKFQVHYESKNPDAPIISGTRVPVAYLRRDRRQLLNKELPDLKTILQQEPEKIVDDWTSNSSPDWQDSVFRKLRFGHPLILQTEPENTSPRFLFIQSSSQ